MKRPFKKFRRFVLIDGDKDLSQQAVDTQNQQGPQPDGKTVITEKPDPEELETSTFSQK